MSSLILPAHIAAERAPVAQLSPRDLGASGNRLWGMHAANLHWMSLMEETLRKGDEGQKRAARAMIEAARDFCAEIEKDLADVSRYNRAVELFKPNDRDISQDVLQGKFDLG